MSASFRLPELNLVVTGILALTVLAVSVPFVAIVLCNKQPKERVLTLREQYPDEHLGI
jgi:hypothetical protein